MPRKKKTKTKLLDNVGSWQQKTYWQRVPAAILYPSLGAPASVNEEGQLHLILLGREDLLPEHVDRCLRIFPEFAPIRSLKECVPVADVGGPLFESPDCVELLEKRAVDGYDDEKPITIESAGFSGFLAKSVLEHYSEAVNEKDAKGTPSRKAHREADKKRYTHVHVVRLDLRRLAPKWRTGGLEHLGGNAPDRRFFLHWMGNPDAPLRQECQDATLERILTSKIDVSMFKEDRWFMGDRLRGILEEERKGPQLPGWNLATMTPTNATPLTTYHPFYLAPPKHADIGFLSDLHLVTKFRLLRHTDIRAIPHWETRKGDLPEDLVPSIGTMVVDTVETLGEHFRRLAEPGTDMVVIGGDLVDFFADLLPSDAKVRGWMGRDSVTTDEKRFPEIWKACEIAYRKSNRDKCYQEGTSALGFYNMVAEFVAAEGSNKPVFVLAGNHDSYRKPYGISPRFDLLGIPALELTKANGGIPADSNLTILEACLAFGSSYETWLDGQNFDPYTLELFYLLYSPLRTWTVKWGQRQPLCLDWGDDEGMFWTEEGADRLGHLPHATDALLESELPVVDWATEQGRPVNTFSHYTWACYKETVPISAHGTVGCFGTKTHLFGIESDVTKYNVGTCEEERDHMYKLFWDRKIQLAISGHAHRAGVYAMTGGRDKEGEDHPGYDGSDMVWITGWHFDQFPLAAHRDKALFVVSDSAGPIPRENRGDLAAPPGAKGLKSKNYKGEWGSRPPSWTRVRFDASGQVEDIRSVYARNPKNKPRLGVMLDYMEVFHAGDPEETPPPARSHATHDRVPPRRRFTGKPLWQVQRYQRANLQTWDRECIRAFDAEEDRYHTNLFSALISEPIDAIRCFRRRSPGLRFFFNSHAMPLPAGLSFAGLDLLWQKTENGVISRIHLEYVPGRNACFRLPAGASDTSRADVKMLMDWATNRKKKPAKIWLRFEFSGQGGYSTDTPWLLWAVGGSFTANDCPQIWIRRDLTPNERPDLDAYHKS
ncbi:MAG: metallophosphoesterase [Fibrobacteria bacterium]|nr:metallophosphoesterase [Fibrobacteria bacterium]